MHHELKAARWLIFWAFFTSWNLLSFDMTAVTWILILACLCETSIVLTTHKDGIYTNELVIKEIWGYIKSSKIKNTWCQGN